MKFLDSVGRHILVLTITGLIGASIFFYFMGRAPQWADDDYTVYYYTFSTIAQTLAGAYGFLLAVAVFLFQSIQQNISSAMSGIIDKMGRDFDRIIKSKTWEEIFRIIDEQAVHPDEFTHRVFMQRRKTLGHAVSQKGRIRNVLILSGSLTIAVICAAITWIPLLPATFSANSWWAYRIALIMVASSIVCLMSYSLVIRELFIDRIDG